MHAGEVAGLACVFAVLAAAFGAAYALQARAERRPDGIELFRTRAKGGTLWLFLGCGLFFTAGGCAAVLVLGFAADGMTLGRLAAVTAVAAVVAALGFCGYFAERFQYVAVTENGVMAYRPFRRPLFVRYDEMGWFSDRPAPAGVCVFSKDGKKLFAEDAAHIGAQRLAARLREVGVKERRK